MEETIKEYLKNHLTIEIKKQTRYDGEQLTVRLLLDKEEISSDFIYLESWDD